jgi:hypothetical protein
MDSGEAARLSYAQAFFIERLDDLCGQDLTYARTLRKWPVPFA